MGSHNEYFVKEPVMELLDDVISKSVPAEWRLVHARTQKKFPPEPKPLLYQTQANYRFTMILEGSMNQYIGDSGALVKHLLKRNDVLLMEPFCANCSEYTSDLTAFFSVLRNDTIMLAVAVIRDGKPVYYKHPIIPDDPALIMLYRSVCTSGKTPDQNSIKAELLYLLLKFLHQAAKNESNEKDRSHALYRKIIHYLHTNYHRELSRGNVAGFFEISPGYVSNLFRNYGRKPFNYVLNDIRLDNACLLLRQTNLTLDAIAGQCGFKYTSYFIRAFRKYYSCSPGAFRARKDAG